MLFCLFFWSKSLLVSIKRSSACVFSLLRPFKTSPGPASVSALTSPRPMDRVHRLLPLGPFHGDCAVTLTRESKLSLVKRNQAVNH